MAKLDRLQAKLAKVDARLSSIESAYPALAKYKSYSKGFGEVSTTYQDFGAVGKEYRELLALQEALQDQIEELSDGENSGSSVAYFRGVS
jgi:prefoldin subunit 5